MVQPQPGERRMIFVLLLIVASIILIVALIFFLAVIVGRDTTAGTQPVPYNVSNRLPPTTSNIRELFPAQLGPFTRKAVSGDLNAPLAVRFSANYANGKDTITINGERDNTVAQALADLAAQAPGVNGSDKVTVQDRNFGYITATGSSGTVRFIYTRSYWLFDITASSRAALDAFMKAFSY